MGIQLDLLTGLSGVAALLADLLHGPVDLPDGLVAVQRLQLHHHPGVGHIEKPGAPGVAHQGRILGDAEVVGDETVVLSGPGREADVLRQDPVQILLRAQLVGLPLIELHGVVVLQEDGELWSGEDLRLHLHAVQGLLGVLHLLHQLLPVLEIEHNVMEGNIDRILLVQGLDLRDPVLDDAHAAGQLVIGIEAVEISLLHRPELLLLGTDIAVEDDGLVQLHQRDGFVHGGGAQHTAEHTIDDHVLLFFCIEAELQGGHPQHHGAVAVSVLYELSVDAREGGNVFYRMKLLLLLCLFPELPLLLLRRCLLCLGELTELTVPGQINHEVQKAHVALLIVNGNNDGNGDQQHHAEENDMKGKVRKQEGCRQTAADGQHDDVCHADAPEKFHFYIDLFRYDSHKSFYLTGVPAISLSDRLLLLMTTFCRRCFSCFFPSELRHEFSVYLSPHYSFRSLICFLTL